ncbi:triglyceride lipase activity [Seminavis robusta]|uniref:Triglyceride lipase activity n=1 Tax=Seminavis robusta TaxID=568900 RepID=A0A9N8H0D3_9STRA|nr:triglyceride lipase activity [Seminavis robusta]|eukprot:Sro19_g013290.1 triglyceride lipase activity (679) ;mRNA; f:28540-30576
MSSCCPCHLQVVLFCTGNGADANSYRPRRDESQWWNRRDALVRCVAAFLFGPRNNSNEDSRELILFYDGDYCRVHMKLEKELSDNQQEDDDDDAIPTEFTIIALWKQAITRAIQTSHKSGTSKATIEELTVRKGRLCCWAVLSSLSPPSDNNNHKSGGSATRVIQDWSKRQLLECLQKECSMEFLREHKLNSAPNVILRKANRTALAKVYHVWHRQNNATSTKKNPKSTSKDSATEQLQALTTIFQEILLPAGQHQGQLIAATLHESSDCELPCFGDIQHSAQQQQDNNKPLHLCLFLGAVRDMIPIEYQALEKACSTSSTAIPLVKVRLGSVPEFTSKILALVAFHHAQQRLGPAMQRLVQQATGKRKREEPISTTTRSNHRPAQLHIICLLPLQPRQIVTDLEQRDRTLWCLVRVLVCSLWRSRLAGAGHSSPLENTVTLILLNGTVVTLHQKEWVLSLAEQHQAAPSEFQVLNALVEKIQQQEQNVETNEPEEAFWNEKRATQTMNALVAASQHQEESSEPSTVISLEPHFSGATDLTRRFYKEAGVEARAGRDLFVLLPIGPRQQTTRGDNRVHSIFFQALNNNPKFQVSRQSIVTPMVTSAGDPKAKADDAKMCTDGEASSVAILQHFLYQDRLFLGGKLSHTANQVKPKDKEDTNAERRKKKRKKEKRSEKS